MTTTVRCDCPNSGGEGAACICRSATMACTALRTVRELLADVYTDEGVRIWINAANRNLAGVTPMSLIMAGRGDEAIEEARRVASA